MIVIPRQSISTPAFIFDERTLLGRSRHLHLISSRSGARLLFALKSLAHAAVLDILKPHVDGFACSSLFEAKLAREIGNRQRSIHLTTPGLRSDQIEELIDECDYIAFNSLPQWLRYKAMAMNSVSCGLRVNPKLQLISDDRYNPCRVHSKLGVPLDELVSAMHEAPSKLDGIQGVHFHNNCDSTDLESLLSTVRLVEKHLPKLLNKIEWINFGGGYLYSEDDEMVPFEKSVHWLRSKYGLKVFIEPGAAFVREAGQLLSSVVDLFWSDGKHIAVLDTTVNHLPEVFEYQCPPEVVGTSIRGRFKYMLAGSTCLAGDLFGEYAFDEPLEVGSKIVFTNAGAYALVKAHTFNGINLPDIYIRKANGELVMQTQYTYEEFARRNGAEANVLV